MLITQNGNVVSSYNEDDFFDALLECVGNLWSFNGGLFDMLWVAEIAKKRKIRFHAQMAGTRIVRMDLCGVRFRDAFALMPIGNLEHVSKLTDSPLVKKIGLPCICPKKCGGYCRITPTMPWRDKQLVRDYCEKDTWALRGSLSKIYDESIRCNYSLKGTIGGTSYASAKEYLSLKPAEWSAEDYHFCRDAYFGGRTEVYQPQSLKGFSYDINSAYPAALSRVKLPCGNAYRISGRTARKAFEDGSEGIYVARVSIANSVYIPPLPYRFANRTAFPTGEWVGTYSALELREAIKLETDITILSAMIWDDAKVIFKHFMTQGFEFRDRAKNENPVLGQWQKWFLNSCTGKLAESPKKERMVINALETEIKRCKCSPHAKSCHCKAWRPMDKHGQVWGAPFWRLSDNSHIHWAAYLTSWARITLGRQLRDDGVQGMHAVYADTDSCYSEIPRIASNELGGWKDEGEYANFTAIAPKAYQYQKPSGEWIARCKGVPGLTTEEFTAFSQGTPIKREKGVQGFKSSAKSGSLFTKKVITRTNKSQGLLFGSRKLGHDGKTYPIEIGELERLWD